MLAFDYVRLLRRIESGERCTWFLADGSPVTARKQWIAGMLKPAGEIVVDAGGKIVEFDAAERSAWIKGLPNPSAAWMKASEARGEPARMVLEAYRDNLKAAGFTYERDYLAE